MVIPKCFHDNAHPFKVFQFLTAHWRIKDFLNLQAIFSKAANIQQIKHIVEWSQYECNYNMQLLRQYAYQKRTQRNCCFHVSFMDVQRGHNAGIGLSSDPRVGAANSIGGFFSPSFWVKNLGETVWCWKVRADTTPCCRWLYKLYTPPRKLT